MSKQVLSIEQMQHLKELGVDTSKASMVLLYKDYEGNEMDWDEVQDELSHPEPMEMFKELYDAETGNYDHSYRKYCGVFTLQDILDLLPKKIETKDSCIESVFFLYVDFEYEKISYAVDVPYEGTLDYKSFKFNDYPSLIDAAYEMLCWCIENGYIKTNKEE